MNGTANAGGVERVVEQHALLLSAVADVRIFSLPRHGWLGMVRRWRVGNLLACALFSLGSSISARLWAGSKGIVISHGFSSIGLACDLVVAHGCWAGYVERTNQRGSGFGYVIYAAEWMAAHLARHVATVSDSVTEQWRQYYGLNPQKAFVQMNSIDPAVFFPHVEAQNPCEGQICRVLFVGRFEPGKGTEFLAALHEEMGSTSPKFHVVICSPTEVGEEERRRLPLFQFLSGLSSAEIAAEYNKADLFLLPSLYEAFELSTIEALACGTPVLLNDTGSRPTLEKLACPGLFKLEHAPSGLAALQSAAERFKGLKRLHLSQWAHQHFDGKVSNERLIAFCISSESSR